MSWEVRTRYSSLPGEKERLLVALDVVDGDRVVAGIPLRFDAKRDEAWHLKQAQRIASFSHSCATCFHFDGDVGCTLPLSNAPIKGAVLKPTRMVCDQHILPDAEAE